MSRSILRKIGNGMKSTVSGVGSLIRRATGESLRPRWVVFEATDRCNSRCTHCNIWKTENDPDPLTPEEIERAFGDELFKDTRYIQITGGEPVLRSDMEEIVLGIHRAVPGAALQLSTNGLLPDRVMNVVKTALANSINFYVGVSLDGIGEAHDRIRGIRGNFKKADRLLHELVALRSTTGGRLHVSAGIVVSDLTLESLGPVREYARRLGIELTEAWYNECSFYGNEGENAFSANLTDAIRSQPPSPLKELWLRELDGRPIKFPCFAMHTFCVLKWNGDIVPCLNLFDESAGNVREMTPTEIWHSPRMKRVRQKVKDCRGCLNSWGAGWSLETSYYRHLLFYLKHPGVLIEHLRRN